MPRVKDDADLKDLEAASPTLRPRIAASPASRAQSWLLEDCFPFWAERAPHPRGGFRERIALDGAPLDDDVSRVRVQARQTYVFARAALLGWSPEDARRLVRIGVDSLLGPCSRPDGLVGKLVRPGVGLVDPQPELYDNAFAIMALAWAARALDAPNLIEEADLILAQLDESHAHPAGGFHETLPPRTPRRQNPHMHIFEASLALYAASGAKRHAARADAMLSLFEQRFLDAKNGYVRELFDDGWAPIYDPLGGACEPGHALEWIALIDVRRRLTGVPEPSYVPRLYDTALLALDERGFAPLASRPCGDPVDASQRTWCQTEALRAHVARAYAGDPDAAWRARTLLDAIFFQHLDPAPRGAWYDHYDEEGRLLTDTITAATGYHLVTAFAEAIESPVMQAKTAEA